MAKNNKLINSMKETARRNRADNIKYAANIITPFFYAALALALKERGWGYKRINDLFVESEKIWAAYVENYDERTMVEVCEEKTGILLLNPNQAIERGDI